MLSYFKNKEEFLELNNEWYKEYTDQELINELGYLEEIEVLKNDGRI